MCQHTCHFPPETIARIASGCKRIESRLNDTKRRACTVGDTIYFVDNADESQVLQAQIVELLRYPTFAELFAAHTSTSSTNPTPPQHWQKSDRLSMSFNSCKKH